MTAVDVDRPVLTRSRAESNRDAAGLLGREADRLDGLDRAGVPAARLLGLAGRLARAATDDLAAAAVEVFDRWHTTYMGQRARWSAYDRAAVCADFADWAAAVGGRVAPARRLWALVERSGGAADGAARVDAAERRVGLAARLIQKAAEFGRVPWEPRDKERFEAAVRDYVPGVTPTLSPDEVKAYFRRSRGEGGS